MFRHFICGALVTAWLAGAFTACTTASTDSGERDLARYVDPTIGSAGHGHVFVGANVPFGGVQLGPTNITEGWDWCSGYHASDTTVIGFAHTHLSGTGIGDKGDILLMPITGTVATPVKARTYLSTYSHARETAQAGYYKTHLDRYGIDAELTATPRTGFHRYTFPATDSARVLINLYDGIGWDAASQLRMVAVNDSTVEGYRLSKGWAPDDRVYFVAEFSKPFAGLTVYADTTVIPARDGRPERTVVVPDSYGILDFGPMPQGGQIEARVAISGVSIAGAKVNLAAETERADGTVRSFDDTRAAARQAWNDLLGHMRVESDDTARLRTFYTAVYHASFFPAVFNDVTGEYRGANGYIETDSTDIYTIFSLWDTYRAAHPLYTITAPERVGDFVNSFIHIFEQQGKVPVWHLAGNETDCMVGIPSVQVVADAILKGIPGFDVEKAYSAIAMYSQLNERGLKQVRERGYIPADEEGESVAKALEYCISDWSVAQVAKKLGKQEDYEYFLERSKNYRHYFDSTDCFMKGRLADGSWRTPFNPNYSTHRGDDYCEGNAWQYTWLVPHDFEGLFALFPSPEAAEAKLDSTFAVPYDGGPNASPDISGLIGQYAQGNEPNHSTIYAYAYLGKQWKTARLARRIMDEFFDDTAGGLCGNEDCGQMSAWYVFNALGFYPANPANGAFVLGSPVFDKVTFPVGGGRTFTVIAENNGSENIYIQSATLNGKPYTKAYITYRDIMDGGELKLVMGPQPNEGFGAAPEDRPRSVMQ
ncbi:GH92 family glycosyl hydrolase [uncultured Rikenella sp.]|uniref:GH92 family glycosyl hydrolase n=1 Tax=uncultured Rikenella sp. TaxID=368003 RepID=UPI002617EAD0|nr:GH92 family glycosyl hydrolase [uncultured Rikenella sp.]